MRRLIVTGPLRAVRCPSVRNCFRNEQLRCVSTHHGSCWKLNCCATTKWASQLPLTPALGAGCRANLAPCPGETLSFFPRSSSLVSLRSCRAHDSETTSAPLRPLLSIELNENELTFATHLYGRGLSISALSPHGSNLAAAEWPEGTENHHQPRSRRRGACPN